MANPYAGRYIRKEAGFRSGLEFTVSKQLEAKGVKFDYELWKIPYVVPASNHHYCPDFLLPNGIFVETKGLWEADDRKKHLLIRRQYPELDIRLVFSSSKSKIYKGSPTSYAQFCEKNNIMYADRLIPAGWFSEPKRDVPFDKFKQAKGGK
ncbi:endonuclease [Pectobacterium phage Jarilo]|uniref:Endonuclease n=1 Tax=Pectobacterium phage Jarilo TaxID=2163634 RepID=A0A2S1GSX8_9CAUD|nr:endonuclease [Pectobacterium phage Jarilo]AWD92497.1 endonuclease [Pectobacterium phage Jarilo]